MPDDLHPAMRVPYLDYAATTPVDPRVIEAMLGALGIEGNFGNPASRSHVYGARAGAAVESARAEVAALLHADPREIVFTSGATESNNLALKGIAALHPRGHIVTSAIEHRAVLDPCVQLEARGHPVSRVRPTAQGRVEPDAVAASLRPDTCVVSVMHANNETGTINDIAAIGALCRERGIAFHTDAAQSAGTLPLDLGAMAVDLLSLSGHKLCGPKGIGALYVRRRAGLALQAQIHGGGQERGLRAGTQATHQIIGLGRACALAAAAMAEDRQRIAALRDRLQAALAALGGVQVHGGDQRLCGHLNVGMSGVRGELLLPALSGIAVSSGSACTSASLQPSHVLKAMGVDDELAHASLRFSLGRFSCDADVDRAIAEVGRALQVLREVSSAP